MISFMNSYLVNLSTWFQRSIRDFTGIQEDKWWWFWSCLFHSGGSRWTATVLLSCVAMTPIAHCNNDDSCFGLGCGKGSCIICCCIKSWFVQYFLQMSIPFLHLVQSYDRKKESLSHVFSSCSWSFHWKVWTYDKLWAEHEQDILIEAQLHRNVHNNNDYATLPQPHPLDQDDNNLPVQWQYFSELLQLPR